MKIDYIKIDQWVDYIPGLSTAYNVPAIALMAFIEIDNFYKFNLLKPKYKANPVLQHICQKKILFRAIAALPFVGNAICIFKNYSDNKALKVQQAISLPYSKRPAKPLPRFNLNIDQIKESAQKIPKPEFKKQTSLSFINQLDRETVTLIEMIENSDITTLLETKLKKGIIDRQHVNIEGENGQETSIIEFFNRKINHLRRIEQEAFCV